MMASMDLMPAAAPVASRPSAPEKKKEAKEAAIPLSFPTLLQQHSIADEPGAGPLSSSQTQSRPDQVSTVDEMALPVTGGDGIPTGGNDLLENLLGNISSAELNLASMDLATEAAATQELAEPVAEGQEILQVHPKIILPEIPSGGVSKTQPEAQPGEATDPPSAGAVKLEMEQPVDESAIPVPDQAPASKAVQPEKMPTDPVPQLKQEQTLAKSEVELPGQNVSAKATGKETTAEPTTAKAPLEAAAVPNIVKDQAGGSTTEQGLEQGDSDQKQEFSDKAQAAATVDPTIAGQERPSEHLAAQVKAQHSYNQPAMGQATSLPAKPDLATLDLRAGSLMAAAKEDLELTRLGVHAVKKHNPLHASVRHQVLQRVAAHLKTEMGRENLTIRLNPENLGQVELKFQAGQDDLNIVMHASSPEAEKALQEGAQRLAESIAAKSPRWQMVDIRVQNKGQQNGQQEDRESSGGQEQESGREPRQQGQGHSSEQHGHAEAGDWADFHLGG